MQGHYDGDAQCVLREAGESAVPLVVEALHDPRARNTRFGKTSHASDPSSPLEALADVFEPFAPAAAVIPLAPLAGHPDKHFRKHAALALGTIGNDDCIPPLTAALADPDDYVRTYALMGIRRSLTARRATPRFLRAMFDRVVPLLRRRDFYPGRFRRWLTGWRDRLRRWVRLPVYSCESGNFNTAQEVPLCLLEMDRERAVPILLDPTLLCAENRYLYRVLEALNEHEVAIPPQDIQRLLRDLGPKVDDYFVAHSCAQLLKALARSGEPGAEATIHGAAGWDWPERFRQAPSEALGLLAGVKDPTGHVLRRLERVGFKRLTKPQKVYYCVWLLDAEVCDGGFAQYFVNSSGDLARVTLKALKVLGAARAEVLLRRAMAAFGESGPSGDRDARHEELAALFDEKEADLNALDDEFYRDVDHLAVLLRDFARKYKKHFGARGE